MLFLVFALLPARAGQLDELAWLAGCWMNPRAEPGSGEFWQPLAGRSMMGLGRTIRGGKTVEHEFLLLQEDELGRAVYTAAPSNQATTSFVARDVTASVATFENPRHDFPQRIIYRRVSEDSMVVRIEGQREGTGRAVEFQFMRGPCAR